MSESTDALTAPEVRLEELLLRWQEQRRLGEEPSAEELAAGEPGLVAELGRRMAALRSMEDLLGLGDDTAQDSVDQPPTDPDATRPYGAGEGLDQGPVPSGLRVPGYRIEGLISRGGMGAVYRARQLKPDRPVALKMILSGRHAGPEQRRRFRSEAEAAARLNHPNVVQIYEVGEHDGQAFFSMELVDGGSLAQRLGRGPIPSREAAALVAALADAVAYAHGRGVVHRDLKPANVLLAVSDASKKRPGSEAPDRRFCEASLTEAVPKITDFGLAKRVDRDAGQTPTVAILGTPSYMAPEQAEGKSKEVGPAADVYALGAILYELLTGRPPFRGETEVDTLCQVLQADPVPPSRLQPSAPRDLETICLKCLQKEPGRRYGGAAALADDLRRWLDGRPILARPTPWWEAAGKWVRRHPAWSGLLAVSAVALAALLGVWIWFTAALQQQAVVLQTQRDEIVKKSDEVEKTNKLLWAERNTALADRDRAKELLAHCLTVIDKNARDLEGARQAKEQEGTAAAAFYVMAAVYAQAAVEYSSDAKLADDDRRQIVKAFDDAAMSLLQQADKWGYFDGKDGPRRVATLKDDPRLNRLRAQPRFQEWIKTLRTR
jgi:serine/threonine protein kinase